MEHLVIYYLPLFVFGIVAFQWSARICAKWEVALVLLPSAALLCVRMGAPVTLVSLAAGFLIVAFPSWTNAPLAFFGTLSYSLYLFARAYRRPSDKPDAALPAISCRQSYRHCGGYDRQYSAPPIVFIASLRSQRRITLGRFAFRQRLKLQLYTQ
jgi:hypothetical protein